MINLIRINWFNRSSVWIWNWFRVKFNWKIWSVKFNTTIINVITIKPPHDIWNQRAGVGRICPVFEVSCWSLAVPLSLWFIWFFTMKGVELIYLSYKNCWEKFWATDDAGISFVSISSTKFTNTLLFHAESCNNCLERCCIIVDGIRRTKIMRVLTWSVQLFWRHNHL